MMPELGMDMFDADMAAVPELPCDAPQEEQVVPPPDDMLMELLPADPGAEFAHGDLDAAPCTMPQHGVLPAHLCLKPSMCSDLHHVAQLESGKLSSSVSMWVLTARTCDVSCDGQPLQPCSFAALNTDQAEGLNQICGTSDLMLWGSLLDFT